MDRIIDEPTPFDDLATWRAFLSEIRGIKPRTPEIEEAIEHAYQMVQFLEIGEEDG